MYDVTQKYIDRKVGEWFGDIKTYKRSRDVYWSVMFRSGLSPRQTNIGYLSGVPDMFPQMTPEEYTYWHPYQMLMQDKFSPLLIHGKEENN